VRSVAEIYRMDEKTTERLQKDEFVVLKKTSPQYALSAMLHVSKIRRRTCHDRLLRIPRPLALISQTKAPHA
jgi:hypothetical protein